MQFAVKSIKSIKGVYRDDLEPKLMDNSLSGLLEQLQQMNGIVLLLIAEDVLNVKYGPVLWIFLVYFY